MDILGNIYDIDCAVLLFVNRMHCSLTDDIMWLISDRFIWVPFYMLLTYFLYRKYGLRSLMLCLISVALCICMADQLGASVIRPLIERPRPSHVGGALSAALHHVNDYHGGSYGFPSCHAANTLGLTFFLFFVYRNKRLFWGLLAWALSVCYSRLYLGVHYPTDLIAGSIVGVFSAAIAAIIYYLLNKAYYKAKDLYASYIMLQNESLLNAARFT